MLQRMPGGLLCSIRTPKIVSLKGKEKWEIILIIIGSYWKFLYGDWQNHQFTGPGNHWLSSIRKSHRFWKISCLWSPTGLYKIQCEFLEWTDTNCAAAQFHQCSGHPQNFTGMDCGRKMEGLSANSRKKRTDPKRPGSWKIREDPSRIRIWQKLLPEREAWAEGAKRLYQIEKLFQTLYQLNMMQKQDFDSKELVFAFGLFETKATNPIHISHPLFTKKLRISDAKSEENIIEVFDTGENLEVETSFFQEIRMVLSIRLLKSGKIS